MTCRASSKVMGQNISDNRKSAGRGRALFRDSGLPQGAKRENVGSACSAEVLPRFPSEISRDRRRRWRRGRGPARRWQSPRLPPYPSPRIRRLRPLLELQRGRGASGGARRSGTSGSSAPTWSRCRSCSLGRPSSSTTTSSPRRPSPPTRRAASRSVPPLSSRCCLQSPPRIHGPLCASLGLVESKGA
jgi:hypothetical protein